MHKLCDIVKHRSVILRNIVKMNRLLIVGNGFDLAHDLKTRYSDFLNHYWNQLETDYEDELISFHSLSPISCKSHTELQREIQRVNREWLNHDNVSFEYKNKFFELLNEECNSENWVDIELFYYKKLKRRFEANPSKIIDLNNEFEKVKLVFEKYIQHVVNSRKNLEDHRFEEMSKLFTPLGTDTQTKLALKKKLPPKALQEYYKFNVASVGKATRFHILNFNYTDTLNVYNDVIKLNDGVKINHIHGEAGSEQNKVIFGFGDERDDLFTKLENTGSNEYLRFMKSSFYFRTRNYFDLLNFLEDRSFLVEILGHSCGLSDRTLLKNIFEHSNCTQIFIHYHETKIKDKIYDNFNDLTLNISRHFENKITLREKVANKEFCTPLPQKNPKI